MLHCTFHPSGAGLGACLLASERRMPAKLQCHQGCVYERVYDNFTSEAQRVVVSVTVNVSASHVQVMRRLPQEQHRHALKCFWASAVAVVASSGAGFPTPDALRTAVEMYGSMHDAEEPESSADTAGGVRAWPEIVQRAYEEEEEHNIKLAYVCRELWKRYDRWHALRVAADTFTTTPNIGPGKAAFKA